MKYMKTAVTIAGSDSSGGAGIQADIKTMLANGVYAMSAITALTAQNTTGVSAIFNATPEFLAQELDSVFTDIFPDAVKIGMVSDRELISVIARKLKEYQARNIVVDPVMVATSGARLISEEIVRSFLEREVDEVHIIYTQMQNAVVMEPVNMQLLPLKKTSFSPIDIPAEVHQEEIEMFPSADGVLDIMIPNYLTGVIYGCLVEAYASENNARMTAMQSSTDSAKKMLQDLSIQYNRARQAAITQEITEVCSGAKAQKRKGR